MFEEIRVAAYRFEKILTKVFCLLSCLHCSCLVGWSVAWLVGWLVIFFVVCSCCLHVWLFGLACFADLLFRLSGAVCVRACFVSLCSTSPPAETRLTVYRRLSICLSVFVVVSGRSLPVQLGAVSVGCPCTSTVAAPPPP